VLDIILDPKFLSEVKRKSDYLEERLQKITSSNDGVKGVKGLGMLKGLDIADESKLPEITAALQREELLVLRSGTSILRIAPPLVISIEELGKGLDLIEKICSDVL
jgi:acetylornithine aminotransferase